MGSSEELDDFADDDLMAEDDLSAGDDLGGGDLVDDGDIMAATAAAPPPAAPPPAKEKPAAEGGGFVSKLMKSVLGGKKDKAPKAAAALPDMDAEDAPAMPAMPAGKPGEKKKMPGGPLVTVVSRNEFYRDGFRRLLWITLFQVVVIVCVLIALIAFITTGKSQDRYFATTADGRIMQLAPLDRPGTMTTAALMSWVALATSEVMTFGYNDYQRRLQQSARHFTHTGWETFTSALQASRIIDGVIENKETVTTSPRSAPILVQEGVIRGKYRWIVKLSLQLTFDGNAETARKTNLNVTLVIERVPSLENPAGVGIQQWISTQGK